MTQSTHNLSITMTADMNAAIIALGNSERRIRELMVARRALSAATPELTRSINQEILALKEEQLALGKRAGLVAQNATVSRKLARELEGVGAGNGKFNQALGQASFAVEDFMSVIETMGFSGAMRAAGNNLSMIGHILGGPLVGGAVGFAAVAGPMLYKSLSGIGDAAEKSAEKLNKLLSAVKESHKLADIGFENKFAIDDIGAIDSLKGVEDKIRETEREIQRLNREAEHIKEQKLTAGEGILNTVSLKNEMGAVFAYLKGESKEFGEEHERHITAMMPVIEAKILAIHNNLRNALTANPQDVDKLLKKAKEQIETLKQEATAEAFGRRMLFSSMDAYIPTWLQDDLIGNMAAAFGTLEDKLTIPSAQLEKMKSTLDAIHSSDRENNEKNIAAKKRELELQAELAHQKRLQADAQDLANKKTLASLEAYSYTDTQKSLAGLMDEERKIQELFNSSAKGPSEQRAYEEALASVQMEKMEELSDKLEQNTDTIKDATVVAADQRETARQAAELAAKQSREASSRKEEVPRAEIVRAIDRLAKALDGKQSLLTQSGGAP